MDYILEVKNLSKSYEKSDFALKGVSFHVPYGSIVGFVGENGAGKTTTVSCILNTLLKDSGDILIFGNKMTDANTDIREDIGVVFDASNFGENLSPAQLEKVMEGIYTKWDTELYHKYLEQFQIPFDKKIKTFSRGMSMKLSIAAALSHQSKLLILDEATSGLDPIIRDEILDVFLEFVQDEKHSILLSSHITSDLEKIADYIVFIHNGEIQLEVQKDELIYNYVIGRCRADQFLSIDQEDIIAYRKKDYQTDVLMRHSDIMKRKYKDIVMDSASIDDVMLLMIKGERG